MRHSLNHRRGLALALAVSVIAADALAQDPQPQQPTFRTGTNFVRVDVYPTKDGRPVQGLTAGDFEVFEDGVRQRIETFEYVQTVPAGPHTTRRDPSTQQEALQQAANPRSRVFIIFLDTPNVTVGGSHEIKEPLIRLIDRILGPEDLVAVMTPAMTTANLVLGRKTEVLEQQLRENWTWGTRAGLLLDAREQAYHSCYPPCPDGRDTDLARLTQAMIARKRERATFEALHDLVRWLHGVRDERKAVITITEGWVRYRPDPELMKLRRCGRWEEPIPGQEVISVDPTGKLTTRPTGQLDPDVLSKRECDTDRMRLAAMDNEQFFRQILDDANRANASFYPVDPRGMPAFDSPIGPDEPPPPTVDAANLRDRLDSLHELALGTDGIAILNSNDLDANLRRIGDDLTSYYLLGYYSTNTELDGKFRRLEVNVKKPGVNVRARRGYRAPTAEEVATARAEAEAAESNEPSPLEEALERLTRIPPEPRFTINAAAHTDAGRTTVWIAGDVPGGRRGVEFAQGGTAGIEIRAGNETASSRVSLTAGERTFLAVVTLDWVPPEGAEDARLVEVRARLTPEGSTRTLGAAAGVDGGQHATQPLAYRRGPSTGNRLVPAATFRFSRSERVRFELPVPAGTTPGPARLLDRAGGRLQLPVKVYVRTDDRTGQQWVTADVTLAPLAAGDYVLELTTSSSDGRTRDVLTAFRVTR